MSFCFVLVFVFVLFLASVYPYNEPNSILCFKFWIDASNSNIFLSSAADFASTPVAANKLTIDIITAFGNIKDAQVDINQDNVSIVVRIEYKPLLSEISSYCSSYSFIFSNRFLSNSFVDFIPCFFNVFKCFISFSICFN